VTISLNFYLYAAAVIGLFVLLVYLEKRRRK
jgi:hypothetical protein